MPVRRFVVIVLPARDTRLGTLSAETGCYIQLLARRAPGPAYDIEFEARALDADKARRTAAEIGALADLTYSVINPATMEWRAAARVPLENVASRTCRTLARVTLDAGWAWMVTDAGIAQLRLLPAPGVAAEDFAREIRGLLETHQSPWDLYTANIESDWYDAACNGHHAPLLV